MIEEFDDFINRPENADRLFEYIAGEIVEVVLNNHSSEIGALLLIKIGGHVLANNLGRVTGADGGYVVSGDKYIPSAAFISFAKQPKPSHETYNPDCAILVGHRLHPGRRQVNNRQTPLPQPYWPIGISSVAVRATMRDAGVHTLDHLGLRWPAIEVEKARDSAHYSYLSRRS